MKKYCLAAISGILLGITFRYSNLAFLAWVGVIPFLYSLEKVSKKTSFYLGLIMGIFYLAISSYWFMNPLIEFSGYPMSVILLIFILGIFIINLYFGLFAFILKSIERKFRLPFIILVPTVWTSIEFLRTLVSLEFLFAYLGYSQAFMPKLIQLAKYGGVSIITFTIILINTAIYLGIRYKNKTYLIVAIITFLIIFSYGSWELNENLPVEKIVKVGVVQPNIPQRIKMSPKHQKQVEGKILSLTEQELNQSAPDLLIWPETAILRAYYEDWKFPYIFTLKKPLLIGGHIREEGRHLNSSFLVDEENNIIQRYSKVKLVPWGEYVPFPNIIPDFIKTKLSNIKAGEELISFNYKDKSWIVAICSEILNPFHIRALYKQDDFIVNISNEAWFGNSHAQLQVFQAGIFRAVEHQVPMIKVGNVGISGLVDAKGRILKRTDTFKTDRFTLNVKIPERKETFYSKYNNLFAWFNLIFTILLFMFSLKQKKC